MLSGGAGVLLAHWLSGRREGDNRKREALDQLEDELTTRLTRLEDKVDDIAERQAGNSAVLDLVLKLVQLSGAQDGQR